MTGQQLLLKLASSGLGRGPLRAFLQHRTWRVEAGEAAGLRLRFPQNTDFVLGTTERPMQRCIAQHLAPGDVFYDIGANIGFFSLLATKYVGDEGSVYAFEPVAENVVAVRSNARLNNLNNLSVFEVAIAAQSGAGELFVTQWDGGSSLSATALDPNEPVERRRVSVVAMDDLVASEDLRPPTLVKIDVEGAEFSVLEGMKETIVQFKPILVYEVDDGDRTSFDRRWKELDQFVGGLGYRIKHLEDSYSNVGWYVGHSVAVPHS
jgi:FkbM family methyltransferase